MRTFAALALACALGVSPARAERPYTVEDLLSLEDLGRAAFSPDGRWLILERQGPFKDAPNFDHEWLHSQTISRLLVMDVTSDGPPRDLLPADPRAGDTFGAFSPDGARVLVFRLKDHRREMGVVTLATGETRWSGLTVEAEAWNTFARWRNDREVIVVDKPPEIASLLLGAGWQTQARMTAAWADQSRGLYSGVVIGSGRYRDLTPAPPPLSLVAFNATSGAVRPLAKGAYVDMLLSPGGAYVAMIEEEGLVQPDASVPKTLGGELARWRRLSLIDLETGRRTAPCARCDLMRRTWSWSPDGKALVAAAREGDRYGKPYGYWRFSLDGRALPLAPDLAVDVGWREVMVQPQGQAAWIGGQPAGLARRAGDARADWWSLGPKPRNLTAKLGKPLGLALASDGKTALIRTVDGVFRLDGRTAPVRVADVGAQLTPGQLQPGERPSVLLDQAGARTRWLSPGGTGDRAAAADPALRVLAFSARSGAVLAASQDPHGVTRVTLLRRDAAPVAVTTINQPLAEVQFAEAIGVQHKGLHGEALTSWLYLTAGHKVTDDRGLVIIPYPGTRYDVAPAGYAPGSANLYTSVQLLVAKGYAVLAPSLPLAQDEPLAPRLAEAILLAVDAARRQQAGLSATKLALWGQSFGGTATLLAGAESPRFKALIASAPITDPGWIHDTLRPSVLAAPEVYTTLGGFAAYTESGQGRLGAKPEDAPELYRANSPRYQAGKINAPVLMLFGDNDFGVMQALGMFSALARDGKDVQLVVYRGEQHAPISPGNIRDTYRRAFDFLAEAFGGPEAVSVAPSAS